VPGVSDTGWPEVIAVELTQADAAAGRVLQVTMLNGGELCGDEFGGARMVATVDDGTLVVREDGAVVVAMYRGAWKVRVAAPLRQGPSRPA